MPNFKQWVPLIIQTIALFAGGMVYATGQEHRVTIIEESIKAQQQIIQQQQETQKLLAEELRTMGQTLEHVVTIESFFHGELSKDEIDAYYRAKKGGRHD